MFKTMELNKKGFTLLELVVALGISALIILTTSFVLFSAKQQAQMIEVQNKLQRDYSFASEYIKNEIHSADEVLSIEGIAAGMIYNETLGFILENEDSKNGKYVSYYYNSAQRRIQRIAFDTIANNVIIGGANLGHNVLCENVKSIEGSYFDKEKSIIRISLVLEYEGYEELSSTDIYIRSKKKDK